MIELAAGRLAFPGSSGSTAQLNAAAKSIVSRAAADAIAAFAADVGRDAEAAYDPRVLDLARSAAAHHVCATPSEIALIPSTSVGLNVLADSIPLRVGDNVVSTDLEFVSIVAPWQHRCASTGAELRIVPSKLGRLEVGDIAKLVDRRTRAVVLSSVVWTNGYRLDLAELAGIVHSRGAPLLIDGIQHLGTMPLDVRTAGLDALVTGGHKWLASPSAMGFLYVTAEFSERYAPTMPYAPTMSIAGQDWADAWSESSFSPYGPYLPAAGARRFEVGVHHAALSARGLAAALDVLDAIGSEAIAAHVLALGAEAAEGLAALGLRVVTPMEPSHRSGLIVFDMGSPAVNSAVTAHLLARNVVVSTRYTNGIGGVRVSCHLYNDSSDLAQLFAGIRSFRQVR